MFSLLGMVPVPACGAPVPQCGNACGTDCGACGACWEQRGTSHQPHSDMAQLAAKPMSVWRVLPTPRERRQWESTERRLPEPLGSIFVNSRASRSCRQNNAPYCSGQNRNPDLSVSAAPQLPRLLAFPLGDSSRKRSSIAPVRGQWPWCSTELHRQFLAFDSRRRKTSKSLKERTLHLNCQNCLPKVQETEKVFVE